MNRYFYMPARLSRFERRFLGIAWIVIAAKCLFVSWAVSHYHMPISAGVIIGPTLFFAGLVTVLWVTYHD